MARIGLAGDHQRQNASLAVYLAHTFLQRLYPAGTLPESSPTPLNGVFIKGLQRARWPGRCQEIQDPGVPGVTWFLDGAHTVESLVCGMEWFAGVGVGVKPNASRFVIILSHMMYHVEHIPSYLCVAI